MKPNLEQIGEETKEEIKQAVKIVEEEILQVQILEETEVMEETAEEEEMAEEEVEEIEKYFTSYIIYLNSIFFIINNFYKFMQFNFYLY